MENVIEIESLVKSYGEQRAVDGVSLQVESGTVFGLLGANGAGKSTLIECVLGTKRRDGGTIRVLGLDPLSQRKRLFAKVGVQFQDCAFQSLIRVDELCEITACAYRNPASYRDLLRKFGLGEKLRAKVARLSGGERQRLFIVLALLCRPALVFLDELTTGLDTRARREVWKHLTALKEEGLTVFLTSHAMEEVEALCDKIAILRRGRLVFTGTAAEALAGSGKNRFEDAYEWYAEAEEA